MQLPRGRDFEAATKKLSLSPKDLSELFEVNPSTIHRWFWQDEEVIRADDKYAERIFALMTLADRPDKNGSIGLNLGRVLALEGPRALHDQVLRLARKKT